MAERAMEVIGGILGLPSKDAVDGEETGEKKTSSIRRRRHTAETNPTRRTSIGSSRRSSKDNGRPPSGSSKYDLDAIAQQHIRKKANPRPTSVKEKMVAHTVDAISSAVEGVKHILINPHQVGVEPTTPGGTAVNEFFPESSEPPVVDVTITHLDVAGDDGSQKPLRSNDSLLNPPENIAEAVPVPK